MQLDLDVILNPSARSYESDAPDRQPMEFHRRLPDYRPGPLISAPAVASGLGLGEVWIKDESNRFDLPAFKVLGASWAAYRALAERLPRPIEPWSDLEELKARLAPLRPLTLVAATAGNHGRALARIAALLEFQADIFVPSRTTVARIEAIRAEGATVTVVEGTYDDALQRATEDVGDRRIIVSDMTWPGYETIPQWAIDGYSTIFWEADELLERAGGAQPDVVVAQIG
jgi:diaminopropionate ammonia-lyase